MKPFKIGLIGGMGPLAGLELHRLIIEATPAKTDQDHLQVILYTNPKIPDRTASLRDNDGWAFAAAVRDSARFLDSAGVDVIAMACMTAHSRLPIISEEIGTPILNGVALTKSVLSKHYAGKLVALLATEGSVGSGIYGGRDKINWILPDQSLQLRISQAIYLIKAGQTEAGRDIILEAVAKLHRQGAQAFVLGCTELGLLYDAISARGFEAIDPLRILAQNLVFQALRNRPPLTLHQASVSLAP